MAKIWKVAHLKMDMFSVKMQTITIIVVMTAKAYWVRYWATHFTQIISLNALNRPNAGGSPRIVPISHMW